MTIEYSANGPYTPYGCPLCGAVVWDRDQHTDWHDLLSAKAFADAMVKAFKGPPLP